jgi:hypothetical protein
VLARYSYEEAIWQSGEGPPKTSGCVLDGNRQARSCGCCCRPKIQNWHVTSLFGPTCRLSRRQYFPICHGQYFGLSLSWKTAVDLEVKLTWHGYQFLEFPFLTCWTPIVGFTVMDDYDDLVGDFPNRYQDSRFRFGDCGCGPWNVCLALVRASARSCHKWSP